MGDPLHLARRFFGSIQPGPPAPDDESWAESRLLDGERLLWRRMSNPDRRHAVEVARAVEAELGGDVDRPILAAALLHDVGKVDSDYRTPARVVATLVWAVIPAADRSTTARRWAEGSWPLRRLGRYRLHPELGERLLADAGSDALTSSWAGDHHRPAARWRIDEAVGAVLKACDDD